MGMDYARSLFTPFSIEIRFAEFSRECGDAGSLPQQRQRVLCGRVSFLPSRINTGETAAAVQYFYRKAPAHPAEDWQNTGSSPWRQE